MRPPWVRSLSAAMAVFAATAVGTEAISTQLSGWQEPSQLEPLHPREVAGPSSATRVPTTRSDLLFSSGGTLTKAVLTSPRAGADVGVVLVHGAGPADRLALLPLAERIAEAGIAVLTYDKRTDGYSPLHRDYLQLAADVSAAADALRSATGAARVGALGISEGGWVVSAAAARADTPLSFVVLASAPVVSPLEQSSWITERALRDAPESVRRAAATLVAQGRLIVDYLNFDPRPLLTRIAVPVLAVWGADDTTVPVNEAYRRLDTASGPQLTAHIVTQAGHDIVRAPDPWLHIATAWMSSPSGPSLTGSEPTSVAGVAVPPDSSLLTDPRVHLAVSAAMATIAGLIVWRRLKSNKGEAE